jgi:hypothetical protein
MIKIKLIKNLPAGGASKVPYKKSWQLPSGKIIMVDIIGPGFSCMEPALSTEPDLFFKKSFFRIVSFVLIVLLNWTGISAVAMASNEASFNFYDAENANENIFSASTLYLSLADSGWQPVAAQDGLTPGDSVLKEINISNSGSLPFLYSVAITDTYGDNNLCSVLEFEVKLNGIEVYNGNLADFIPTTSGLASVGSDFWNFAINLPPSVSENLQDKKCGFQFVFSAWQDNSSGSLEGFSDQKVISNEVDSGEWAVGSAIMQMESFDSVSGGGGKNQEQDSACDSDDFLDGNIADDNDSFLQVQDTGDFGEGNQKDEQLQSLSGEPQNIPVEEDSSGGDEFDSGS